jgi:hypothetical protein
MDTDKDRSFLGTGWGFPPRFDLQNGKIAMVSEDDDIRESLRILLSTNPGERVMRPTFGCGLKARVFESITVSAITEIRDLVSRAILFFEPRITVDDIEVKAEDVLGGLVLISVSYTIRTTNTRSNMVYPFYIFEATNVAEYEGYALAS